MLLFYLTCGSLFLLSFILISNATGIHPAANRWMGVCFLFAGFATLSCIAAQTDLNTRFPLLIPLLEATRFAMAPALFISILHFIKEGYRFSWQHTIHFIPALLFLPVLAGASRYLPAWMGIVVLFTIRAQIILYWLAAYHLLYRHNNKGPTWLKYLLLSIGVMILNQLLTLLPLRPTPAISQAIYLIAAYFACYCVLKQKSATTRGIPEEKMVIALPEVSATTSTYAPPRLQEQQMDILKLKLEELMSVEKLFTEQKLTLPQLAAKMEITVHELSWLLNKGLDKNFYQYINQRRVEEAKMLLQSADHMHLSILAIGFGAGFNSKTAFNNAFRKIVGMTPVDFRNIVVHLDTDGQPNQRP